jgi:hypothetical protein
LLTGGRRAAELRDAEAKAVGWLGGGFLQSVVHTT